MSDGITVSDELIMSAEETHATSLGGPSGFRMAWEDMYPELFNEIYPEDK